MGFFNEVGRRVEHLKQSVTDGEEAGGAFRCRECGSTFDTDHDYCPDCGEAAVVAVDQED